MMRIPLIALALLLGLALAGPAHALTPKQIFGVQDQNDVAMFSEPAFQALKPRATRLIVDWNTARTPGPERDKADAWYVNATAAGVRPLLSFGSLNNPRVPTVREFTDAFRAAQARWPRIREWQTWNEANHATQPAVFGRPDRAARYARAMEKAACRRCTVVPITIVLNRFVSPKTEDRWIGRFLKAYGRTPRIWGVHTYGDANRLSNVRLQRFLAKYRKGRIWITETGGWAKFAGLWPYDERRQVVATRFVFGQALTFRKRIDRLYWYEWRGALANADVRWDSGLFDPRGVPRPAYRTALTERFRTRPARRPAAGRKPAGRRPARPGRGGVRPRA